MSEIKLSPPKIKTTVTIRERKNVLYQVTYDLLKVFHVPNMGMVSKTLYAGIIDLQALNQVTLYFYDKKGCVEFYIRFIYDWDTYEVLIHSSRRDIDVDNKINSIDQFIGRKLAFEKIYKHVLATTNIYSKEVLYRIDPNKESELVKKVGKFGPGKNIEINNSNFTVITYESRELEETQVSIAVKRNSLKPSLYRRIANRFRGI